METTCIVLMTVLSLCHKLPHLFLKYATFISASFILCSLMSEVYSRAEEHEWIAQQLLNLKDRVRVEGCFWFFQHFCISCWPQIIRYLKLCWNDSDYLDSNNQKCCISESPVIWQQLARLEKGHGRQMYKVKFIEVHSDFIGVGTHRGTRSLWSSKGDELEWGAIRR